MKKMLAMLLAVLTLCFGAAAMAESVEVTDVEGAFDGVWVQFENAGFQIYVPSEWIDQDVPDDAAESGFFFIATSEDGAKQMSIMYSDLDGATYTHEDMKAELEASYPGATDDVTINDIQAVACYDSENDIYALAALDSEGTGMFVFYFQPASDDTMTQIADVIVASLSPIE